MRVPLAELLLADTRTDKEKAACRDPPPVDAWYDVTPSAGMAADAGAANLKVRDDVACKDCPS